MSSLFKSINFSYKREHTIIESLLQNLNENAREIQYEISENSSNSLELTDATNSLCTTLEAIFLHGLKDSFLWQTIQAIKSDVDHRPEPSFWLPILVFLHKQTIEQVHSLNQITTEIGYCRSWIRLSLNECLFSSYLNNIRKNSSALTPYYKKIAFLKDSDNLDIASKILEGIESSCEINLPVNSSLLNQWPNYSLQLSGIWTPPLKSCPITSGVDVASSITEVIAIPTPKPVQTNELFSESISNSPFSRTSNFAAEDLSHRENMDIFLEKVDEMEEITEEATEGSTKDEVEEANASVVVKSPQSPLPNHSDVEKTFGNSLTTLMNTSWSTELRDPNRIGEDDVKSEFNRSNSMTSSISSLKSPIERYSYNTLLRSYEKSRTVDWTEIWERFECTLNLSNELLNKDLKNTAEEKTSEEPCDFEIIVGTLADKFTLAELQDMVEKSCKLANEPGLDSQGFLCKGCAYPIGIGFAPSHVCCFTGNYFCFSCMNTEEFLIPAKIIYNWDFKKYPVSKRSAIFLAEYQIQPFIDLKLLNPEIYQSTEEMASLQSLRIRLNFIRAYLYTCSTTSIQGLQKLVFSKEHLYEHIHLYTLGDLTMIQKGALASLLQKAVNYGEQHIQKCKLCSVKGFICEICKSPKVLYPFHIETTFRCQLCGSVFHANCLNQSQPCPKCERKRKREDHPLLEAVHLL